MATLHWKKKRAALGNKTKSENNGLMIRDPSGIHDQEGGGTGRDEGRATSPIDDFRGCRTPVHSDFLRASRKVGKSAHAVEFHRDGNKRKETINESRELRTVVGSGLAKVGRRPTTNRWFAGGGGAGFKFSKFGNQDHGEYAMHMGIPIYDLSSVVRWI
ncbi:hypothetical protein CPC08DRAFT_721632 [Agrocybe pediades]|nr:hypothetical protein CPC08DRAFT_721632 [Agrocybe pediades]